MLACPSFLPTYQPGKCTLLIPLKLCCAAPERKRTTLAILIAFGAAQSNHDILVPNRSGSFQRVHRSKSDAACETLKALSKTAQLDEGHLRKHKFVSCLEWLWNLEDDSPLTSREMPLSMPCLRIWRRANPYAPMQNLAGQ